MKISKDTNILIVGLGLIGGSYAKGLTKGGYKVNAIDTNKETVEFALQNNIVEKASTEADDEMIRNADVVIFALYPHIFKEWIRDNQSKFSPGTIITDVTGVKGCIVDDIQNTLREDCEFIAAHPMRAARSWEFKTATKKYFIRQTIL